MNAPFIGILNCFIMLVAEKAVFLETQLNRWRKLKKIELSSFDTHESAIKSAKNVGKLGEFGLELANT